MATTKKIGNITLPSSIVWSDQNEYQATMAHAKTIDGGVVVWKGSATNGRTIRLEAKDGECWLTQTQVDGILGLADDATTTLTWGNTVYTVSIYADDGVSCRFDEVLPGRGKYTGYVSLITL